MNVDPLAWLLVFDAIVCVINIGVVLVWLFGQFASLLHGPQTR